MTFSLPQDSTRKHMTKPDHLARKIVVRSARFLRKRSRTHQVWEVAGRGRRLGLADGGGHGGEHHVLRLQVAVHDVAVVQVLDAPCYVKRHSGDHCLHMAAVLLAGGRLSLCWINKCASSSSKQTRPAASVHAACAPQESGQRATQASRSSSDTMQAAPNTQPPHAFALCTGGGGGGAPCR